MNTTLPALDSRRHVEVFFDGACPLCRREMGLMQRLDRRERVQFTDIADPQFDPVPYGLTQSEFLSEIRGRLPDGSIITGVEVFRALYQALGWGWLVRLSRLPGISHLLVWGYRVFAKNRLKMTGRCEDNECKIR